MIRYLRKIRRHRQRIRIVSEEEQTSPAKRLDASVNFRRAGSNINPSFYDPDFDLSKPETFASIFQIGKDQNLVEEVQTKGRMHLVHEKLDHELGLVEDDIQKQVTGKANDFFQVGTEVFFINLLVL